MIRDICKRYYVTAPEMKSLDTCALHGRSHAEAHWFRQVDPRWTEEQVMAYADAYLAQLKEDAAAGSVWARSSLAYVTNNSVYEENTDNETEA